MQAHCGGGPANRTDGKLANSSSGTTPSHWLLEAWPRPPAARPVTAPRRAAAAKVVHEEIHDHEGAMVDQRSRAERLMAGCVPYSINWLVE